MTTSTTIEYSETTALLDNINEASAVGLVIPESADLSPERPNNVEPIAEQPKPTPEHIATTQSEQETQASPETMQQRLQLLGSITWLMLQSPLHRHYTIEELEARILTSLTLGQFRYYEIQGQPIGFVSWAYLSEETEEKYQTGDYRLSPEEWRSGDRLWCPDFIAPFGHDQNIFDDVQANIFPKGTTIKMIQTQEDSSRSIMEYTF